jgi:hypothetical protein
MKWIYKHRFIAPVKSAGEGTELFMAREKAENSCCMSWGEEGVAKWLHCQLKRWRKKKKKGR